VQPARITTPLKMTANRLIDFPLRPMAANVSEVFLPTIQFPIAAK
jgi:hypothetical protein